MKKMLVWWKDTPDVDCIDKDFIKEVCPDILNDEEALAEYAYEENEHLRRDIISECDDKYDFNKIVCLFHIQTWNGSTNIGCTASDVNDILHSSRQYRCGVDCEYYFDKYNLHGTFRHHDGTDTCIFREMKDGMSAAKFFRAYYNSKNPKAQMRLMQKYTRSLRYIAKDLYGF